MFNNGLPVLSLFCCISLLCLSHCLSTHITCAAWSSAFYALCAISILCTVPLLCYSTAALSSFFTPELPLPTTITTTSNNNNCHLFSVLCIYSFCAPCACNVLHASACILCVVILHLSSDLSDHHRDSSASLVVHTACPTSLNVTLRFLSLSGSLRLFVFSETVELLVFIDPDRQFMILMNQRS
jgi:hypothetical protein